MNCKMLHGDDVDILAIQLNIPAVDYPQDRTAPGF